jgi:hypothetical protein
LGAIFSFVKDGWARGLGGSRFYFYLKFFFWRGGGGGVLEVLIGVREKGFVFLPEWVGPSLEIFIFCCWRCRGYLDLSQI